MTLILAAGLPVMGSVLMSPASPKMLATFQGMGVGLYLVMAAIAAPAACLGLVSPFLGPIVDRFGRRRSLVGALALYGLFGVAPMVLRDIYAIIAMRFLLGMMEAVILTANLTLLGDYFDGERRTKWIAVQSSMLPLFGSVLLIVGEALSGVSCQLPFSAYAFSFVVSGAPGP